MYFAEDAVSCPSPKTPKKDRSLREVRLKAGHTQANFNRYVIIMSHVSPTQYDIFGRLAAFGLV